MEINNLNQVDELSPSKLKELVEKELSEFLANKNLKREVVSLAYHLFRFDGDLDVWFDLGQEEELLKSFELYASSSDNDDLEDSLQIVLNIARNDTIESVDDDEIVLVKYERTEDDKELIKKIKLSIDEYNDTDNYAIRTYDKENMELQEIFVLNRTEKEAIKECTRELAAPEVDDYSVVKLELHEYLDHLYQIGEKRVYEFIRLIS